MRNLPQVVRRRGAVLVLVVLLIACAGHAPREATPSTVSALPLRAAVHPHAIESPNGTRIDDYYWLRDDTRKDPAVLAYLRAENDYYAARMAHAKPLEDKLYAEIVGRIRQDDATPPFRKRGWFYYTRYEPGREYPIWARKRGSLEANEEIMLDVNALAAGHEFFNVGELDVSPDNRLLAYPVDMVGRQQFEVRFRDLATGADLADIIPGTAGSQAWADDNRTLFYVENDPVTLLTTRIKKHRLGTPAKNDVVVYEEQDHSFYLSVDRSGDERYIVIYEGSTLSTEQRFIPANRPDAAFRVFEPRERDHEYEADHIGSRWIVRSNWQAKNFRMFEVADVDIGRRARWREIVPADDGIYIGSFALFDDYLVLGERSGGLQRVRVQPWKRGVKARYVASDEPDYVATLGINPEQHTHLLRYNYSSLATPTTIYDLDLRTGGREIVKREPVLGDFVSANYAIERVWAPARDGAKIPVSLVYRRDRFRKDGTAPLLQLGYGAYGVSMDPHFSSSRLSLLDRGVVYAIAHIRGGGELGRRWYEDGKLLHKMNTFTDFIDVTDYLVAQGYAAKEKVFATGRSAGGLLMGAVANLAPERYRGIVTAVPFVDAVTTMLDESIPLTTNEFDEWGNPKEKIYYDAMMAYSPYDNVAAKAYPAMLVTTGLWDSQVQYYEPAKWVAKLRALKTDTNPLLLRIDMESGHGGKSGRFQKYREAAEQYAFILDQFGIKN